MSSSLYRPFLLCCLILAVFLPMAGAWIRWEGLPPGYGVFPAQKVVTQPGVNLWYYGAGCLVVGVMVAFLTLPRLFGFKAPTSLPEFRLGVLPSWFWGGTTVMATSWALMWFGPELLARFTFVPLWWGFIFALDGVVHALTGGRSIMGGGGHKMITLALVSLGAWHLFEYWNYFLLSNWYYPHADLLTPFGSFIWFSLSFTTVWPVCFEMFMLLMAVPALRLRWAEGWKVAAPRPLLAGMLGLGFALQFMLGLFPQELFWVLWTGPLLIFAAALELTGCWTPLQSVAKGDWSPCVLMGLGTFFTGFVWEFWNFGSQAFRNGVATNPNYWIYDVPYFNVGHLFSEMPVLGYFGYLFFGVLVWLTWLLVANILEFEPDFTHAPHPQQVLEPSWLQDTASQGAGVTIR